MLSVAWGFNTFAFSIVYPFLPLYLNEERGIPMNIAGLVFPVMGIASIISGPISGVLADRFGRRKLIIGGPLGRSAAFIALAVMAALNAPFILIAAGLFCSTLLGSFFQNGSNAYVTDLVAPKDRTVAFSTLRVGLNVGWMFGPAVGSFLAKTPYSLLFTLTGVLCCVTASIPYFFCSSVPHRTSASNTEVPSMRSLLSLLKQDNVLCAILVLTFLMFLSVSQFVSTLSIYSRQVVGIERIWLGFLYTINGAIVIALLIPVNKLLKNTNPALRISTGAFLYIIAFAGFGLSPLWGDRTVHLIFWNISAAWLHLVACITILTFAEMISITAIITVVGHLAPPDKIGRYMGLYGLTMGTSWAFGPYIGSVLFEPLRSHPLLLWLLLSIGAMCGGIGYLVLVAKRIPLSRSHEPARQ